MTALKEDLSNQTTSQSNTTKTVLNPTKEQLIQEQKDRTLFCINIDQNCTEDILYELFVQVGPITYINRKADRNGNIIALITYKHIESCEYAIKLFNGINLFNQPLKVQFSQASQMSTRGSSSNLSSSVQSTPINQRMNQSRQSNIETPNQQLINTNLQPLMFNAQQNLLQLMSPLLQQLSPANLYQGSNNNNNQTNFNRSYSGSNMHENDDRHRHRRDRDYRQEHSRGSSHHGYHQNNQQQQHHQRRDHSNFNDNRRSFKRSRSRSPLDKRRR